MQNTKSRYIVPHMGSANDFSVHKRATRPTGLDLTPLTSLPFVLMPRPAPTCPGRRPRDRHALLGGPLVSQVER